MKVPPSVLRPGVYRNAAWLGMQEQDWLEWKREVAVADACLLLSRRELPWCCRDPSTALPDARTCERKARLGPAFVGSLYLVLVPEKAEAKPRAMRALPEIFRWARRRRKLERKRSATVPASMAQRESLHQPIKANRTPNWKICSVGCPRDGLTNCGRKARKNSAVLGLSRLTSTP